MKDLSIILGNQLFKPSLLKELTNYPIFMCESDDLCTHFKYHQLKIIFFLTAMRNFNDELKAEGFNTFYHALPETKTQDYLSLLEEEIGSNLIKGFCILTVDILVIAPIKEYPKRKFGKRIIFSGFFSNLLKEKFIAFFS